MNAFGVLTSAEQRGIRFLAGFFVTANHQRTGAAAGVLYARRKLFALVEPGMPRLPEITETELALDGNSHA
jgi:hypothetical protein